MTLVFNISIYNKTEIVWYAIDGRNIRNFKRNFGVVNEGRYYFATKFNIFFRKTNYTAVTHDSHDKMLNSCQALMADNNF